MSENTNPGINIEFINLLNSCVNTGDPAAKLTFNLAVTDIQRDVIDEADMGVLISFDLMKDVENPPFEFTATYIARYTRKKDASMTWDEFSNGFVLNHVLPYFREYVTAVTQRLLVPPVYLPPTNIKGLLADYEAGQTV